MCVWLIGVTLPGGCGAAIEAIGAIRRIRIIITNKPPKPTPSDATILLDFLLYFFCEGFSQVIITIHTRC
jgi:hypothetical protein